MSGKTLFPVFEVPKLTRSQDETRISYKPSAAWDMEKGDFVRNGATQLVKCNGREAYKTWCYKMACTERYTCLAYPDALGVELESAVREKTNPAVESAVERTITEALMVNPRTEYVRGFSFTWRGDELHCSFTVKGMGWEEFSLEAELGERGRRQDKWQ